MYMLLQNISKLSVWVHDLSFAQRKKYDENNIVRRHRSDSKESSKMKEQESKIK